MKHQFLTLTVSSLFICFIISCGGAPDSANDQIDKSAIPNQEEQLRVINRRISDNPGEPEPYHQRSKIYLDQKEYTLAMDDVRKAILLDSANKDYYFTASKVLKATNQVFPAIVMAEKAVTYGMKTVEGYIHLGELYFIVKQYQKALAYINESIKADKFSHIGYFYKGLIYYETGDTSRAISNLQTCIELTPEFSEAYNALADINMDIGAYEVAIEYLSSALRFSPNDSYVYYNMGVALQGLHNTDSAEKWYQISLGVDSSNYLSLYNLGKISFNKGNCESCILFFKKVERYRPRFSDIDLCMAECFKRQKDYINAVRHIKRSIENDPENEDLRSELKLLESML